MNKKDKKTENKPLIEIPITPFKGLPETAIQMVNRYGTYEIQATADTENQYPAIAQGYNDKIIETDCENPSRYNNHNNA